jgi:superfamily II DNA or RNA helicase
VLVTVDVVSEGFDIPAASVAILLRPTQSLGLYLQQVGRVLRPAPGKDAAIILDHVGNVTRHGFPDDIRQWSLEHGAKRASGSQPAPSVRTCPACFAAFRPAPQCPVCGANCTPEQRRAMQLVDGELKELKRIDVQLRRREQGKAQTLQQLIAIGHARNMRNPVAWAKHVLYARSLKDGQRRNHPAAADTPSGGFPI